jgi:hypothetical protein
MKKLIAVLILALSFTVPAANASIGGVVSLATFGAGVMFGKDYKKPVPAYLTDACQPRKTKAANGDYFYDSVEHCRKEM